MKDMRVLSSFYGVRRQREAAALSGLPATPLWLSPEGKTSEKKARHVGRASSAPRETKAASPVGLIKHRPPSAAALHKTRARATSRAFYWALLLLLVVSVSACRNGMRDGARLKPLEKTDFFPDGRSERPLVEGTVPRGFAAIDDQQEYFETGKIKGQLGDTLPFPLTQEVLKRGQERFEIFCTPCHDRLGTGQGMIVQRGLARPPSYHIDRLRQAPLGHFVDVMTNGFGAMYSYAYRVPPRDRWAIAAYIRVLQLSQGTTVADVPEKDLQKLEETEE